MILLLFVLMITAFFFLTYSGWTIRRWKPLEQRFILDGKDQQHCCDIVISLTTIPKSFPSLKRTLASIMALRPRPSEIFVNIPKVCHRTGQEYEIPYWLRKGPFTLLTDVEDTGPSTKYLPTLTYLHHQGRSNQLVLVVDDDTVMGARAILEILCNIGQRYPNAALTYGGKKIPETQLSSAKFDFGQMEAVFSEPTWRSYFQNRGLTQKKEFASPEKPTVPVDIIMGHSTYLIRPRFFDMRRLGDYKSLPKEARFVDDIVLSGCLAERKVPRFVVYGWPEPKKEIHACISDFIDQIFCRKDAKALHNSVNRSTHNDDTTLSYFEDAWLNSPH